MRQLYEFDAHIEDFSQGVKPMSKALWKYRRQITVEHLGNSFQQQVLSGGEQQCKVLNAFLKQVPSTFRRFPFLACSCFICRKRRMGRCTVPMLFLLFWAFPNVCNQKKCSSNLSSFVFLAEWIKRDSCSCRIYVNTVRSLSITGTQVAFCPVSSWPSSSPASVDGQISQKNW